MLSELTIENIAVIEKARLLLKNGFTCLTGETGAGKSIIIDSINAIMGDRISKDIVRTGATKASIVAVFEDIDEEMIRKAKEFDIDIEGECIVQRQISAEGKSTARINGIPVPVNVIKSVFQDAINIHGQHDNQSLLNSSKHINILDSFGLREDILQEYISAFEEYTDINTQIKKLISLDKSTKEDLELLQFETKEIEAAELSLEEEENLQEQKKLVKNAEKILTTLNATYELLSGNDDFLGACNALQQAVNGMETISEYTKNINDLSEKLNEAAVVSQDVMFEIKNSIDDFDIDISTMDEVEERLDIYYKLKRKYGATVEDVLIYCDKAKEKLENVEFCEEKLVQLNRQKDVILQKLSKSANILTQKRKDLFNEMSEKIQKSLEFLNMPNVKLFLNIVEKDYSQDGKDSIEFTIITNKGESPKPLAKIASGGELSRIMLAIKSVLAKKETTNTLIFDEIDAGVSGSAALKIGKLLKQTANNRQVICVTHSPQIASFADNHLFIEKNITQSATFTSVRELDAQQRISEVARIISGENITPAAIANANEMITAAQNC